MTASSGTTSFTALALGDTDLFIAVFSTTATVDVPSLTTGSGSTSAGITVTGAKFGDHVLVSSADQDMQGVRLFGWVSAADTVKFRAENNTGGTIDLASGDYNIKVLRG